eukprot:TRINITY_DN20261_c0_g3_i1.p1 TRINITY_DN20261_c0_g3~~TRINITY_DN20261_c0_g3_i1.p1  ORF type:complete len:326 (-),score=50.50 TRINITY_DN20261_c0_g3_i1:76-1053(-)
MRGADSTLPAAASSFLKRPLSADQSLSEFLQAAGLSKFEQALIDEGIDEVMDLTLLNSQHFQKLGVKPIQKLKFDMAIARLLAAQGHSPAAPEAAAPSTQPRPTEVKVQSPVEPPVTKTEQPAGPTKQQSDIDMDVDMPVSPCTPPGSRVKRTRSPRPRIISSALRARLGLKVGGFAKRACRSRSGAAHNMNNVQEELLDPASIMFSHASISSKFRNGRALDSTIEFLLAGSLKMDSFQAIEVVRMADGRYISINNRRLFVFRVLRHRGFVDLVRCRVLTETHPRVSRPRWDIRLKKMASKLQSALTTRDGRTVRVKSLYSGEQA